MWIVPALAIAKKIPLSVWITLGVSVAWALSVVFAIHHGKAIVQADWDASVERGKEAVAQLKDRQVSVNMIVDTVVKERVVTIKEKARVIEKEIPVFIPEYRDHLSGGFRLLYDAAATNTIPDRSRIALAPTVPVGDVASTTNRNFEQCHIWREQLIGWQEWYARQLNASKQPSS
jgi:hypothetical protein